MSTVSVLIFAIVSQLFLFNLLLVSCFSSEGEVPDYYWRDYYGIIPKDAIQGGTDKAGEPTYIGQVYFKNFELLPGTIFPECKCANTTAYGKELTTNKNIKILCSTNKNKLEWISTKNEETHLIINCHFVQGGTQVGQILNIGRVNYGGRIIIGKIFSFPSPYRGLAIPYNGKPVTFQSYEILAYNCKKDKNPSEDTVHVNIDVLSSNV